MKEDSVVYVADSKIEAQAWVASTGKRKYPNNKLEIQRSRSKFMIIKKG